MKINAKTLFSDAQKEKIRQAVLTAERSTRGEIMVMLVDESDQYREAELAGVLSLSALGALALSAALQLTSVWFYIPATVILFVPFLVLFKSCPHLKLALLTRRRVDEAVKERAVYAFFQKGVHMTDEQTGILIFISVLERKVWILADRGIHGKIAPHVWNSLAREVAKGIKEDHAFDALCAVIRKCGAELTRHFPGAHSPEPPAGSLDC
jgi:putative membrane protein